MTFLCIDLSYAKSVWRALCNGYSSDASNVYGLDSSNGMEYDPTDSFHFEYVPYGTPFGS